MKFVSILAAVLATASVQIPSCKHEEEHHVAHKVVATNPEKKSVMIRHPYVCQIHSQRHIQVRALERGYLEAISIKEGQDVKAGDSLFTVIPILYQAQLDAKNAEARLAQLQYEYTKKLYDDKVVSSSELALLQAKLTRAQANAMEAAGQLGFTNVKASFDGIVDRLLYQQGSLVEEGDVLTTLSDNSTMWVYFNVPEARYLEFKENNELETLNLDLVLADGSTFNHPGKIGAVEADFNNENGNISLRADFPNPDRLLRHGQTGTVYINRLQKDAIVIPKKAVFDTLAKRYVYVINDQDIVHQREIYIEHDLGDEYVIRTDMTPESQAHVSENHAHATEGKAPVPENKPLSPEDKIVLEGVQQIREGEKIEYGDPSAPAGTAAEEESHGGSHGQE